jgi:endonuclease III
MLGYLASAMPKRAAQPAGLSAIFDRLEKFYGEPKPPQPTDPYEMLLHRNCGYPQSDERCGNGFRALKKEIGLSPQKILDTPDAKLREVMRPSVMKPELAAFRLKEIAARVLDEFADDMRAVLKRPLAEAKKALKKFPTVGDSTADKILLFNKVAPVAAIPSNSVHTAIRLFGGPPELDRKNWSAAYRFAQDALRSEFPRDMDAQLRAYLLLRQHAQEICKLSHPLCDQCPVALACPYFRKEFPRDAPARSRSARRSSRRASAR